MGYLALYRLFRPAIFSDVIGQDSVTTALKHQVSHGNINHAYLFCGTRGTGKTTCARIFAKAINCENPIDGSPCGVCNTCKHLSDPTNMDIIEIDAASNNRVDEIRELRENVKYPPVHGKYKVYIIDEVHMLTDSAFNALLKTLEEPPSYVVFIMGTTEVHKLPATILSRCMRFDFKLVGTSELIALLKKVFDKQNIKYEEEALPLIASLGAGSVRDTLSIADTCVAYCDDVVTYDGVVRAVGSTDKRVLDSLANHILLGQVKEIFEDIASIAREGKSFAVVAKELTGYLRDMAIVKTCSDYKNILSYPQDRLIMIEKTASMQENATILFALKTFAGLEQEFRYSENERILFEVNALKVATTKQATLDELDKRVSQLEEKLRDMVKP